MSDLSLPQSPRVSKIKNLLAHSAFTPSHLEVIDDSHEHLGHAGAEQGAGHYTVIINSPVFIGQSPVKRHQMVYEILGELIGPEIHALRIQAGV